MGIKKREKTLDYLRGLAIIQVVFVHVLYWLKPFDVGVFAVLKSLLLFEMPVFFFVTGATNSFGKKQPYISFVLKRIKGLLIPYYVYSALFILVPLVYYSVCDGFSVKTVLSIIFSWGLPLDHQIMPLPYVTWALWFVPVYIFSIAVFPAVKKAVLRLKGVMVVLLILLFLVVESVCFYINNNTAFEGYGAYVYTALDIVQKTFFYLIFMGLGVLYPRIKERNTKKAVFAFLVFAVSISGLLVSKFLFGVVVDMQYNKFPPNFVFLFYSFAVMTGIYLAVPFVKKLYLKLAKAFPFADDFILLFSQNSIYVFLYQTIPFLIIGSLFDLLGFKNDVLVFVLGMITIYPMIWLTIKMINKINNIKQKNKT